ncbi:MAG: phytanoyl-CoA dioxygenase family protein [Gemmatimonadaceae bacterium]|nr:phytanoyl-CoA dioxygenase family protein [Gemmatimonadaceae bacterium]
MSDLRAKLLENGFCIVRNAVPPSELDRLRTVFEGLLDRQRRIWRRERGREDPPGGVWERSPQPRVVGFDGLVDDGESAAAVELLLGRPLETSRRIMGAEAAPTSFMMMCSPVRDHGPAVWHRDIHPIDQAPVAGLQRDLLANGPGYLQWNLPLYDDPVLWVVPGSHRRPNTEAESQALAQDPRRPLPGGVPVELAAGDAVVYTNLILHWGSDYSRRLRRTVHFGHRSFGGDLLPYVAGLHRRGDPSPFLGAADQEAWRRHRELYETECDLMEAAFRAAIAGDGPAFLESVARLHPGESMREVCLILLSKLARKLARGPHPERPGYGGDFTQDRELKPRFGGEDLETLWRRFGPLDDMLKAPGGREYVPGYQSGPMSYRFESFPGGLTLESFVDGWETA